VGEDGNDDGQQMGGNKVVTNGGTGDLKCIKHDKVTRVGGYKEPNAIKYK